MPRKKDRHRAEGEHFSLDIPFNRTYRVHDFPGITANAWELESTTAASRTLLCFFQDGNVAVGVVIPRYPEFTFDLEDRGHSNLAGRLLNRVTRRNTGRFADAPLGTFWAFP